MGRACIGVIALSAAALSACGTERTINGGLFALPTARGHIPVGGIVSAQAGIGHVAYLGGDATLRVTGDYGHGALGMHLAAIGPGTPVAPYARLGYAPIAASLRDGTLWYAMNTSLELGYLFNANDPASSTATFTARRARSAFTLGVRGDLEYRPGQDQVDVFVSLVFGWIATDVTNLRGLPLSAHTPRR